MKRKNVIIYIIMMMLVTAMIVPTLSIADEYEPQDTHSGHLVPSSTQVELWDTFNITLYINSGTDTVDAFVVRQMLWDGSLVKVSSNPGGVVNVNLNSSFFTPWKGAAWTCDDGNLNNTDGEISYGPQTFSLSQTVSGNHSAARLNMTAIYPGSLHVYLPWTSYAGNKGLDIGGLAADWWTNCTIEIHPQNITSLTASAYNHTAINVSWTKNNVSDNVTLCGKEGSYPANPTDSVLYNGSNLTYNHTSLNNCTTYYYRAWAYNESCGWHSLTYFQDTATTHCYTNISLVGAIPTNDSTIANCTYSQTVNVTIRNSQGRTCLYWINATNGQSTSGSVLNNSVSLAMTGLSHNTTYWWNVTASEQGVYGSGDSTQTHYHFTTGEGGGTAPTGSNPYPSDTAISQPIYNNLFNCTGTDVDGDPINATFLWSDNSVIGYDEGASGNVLSAMYTGVDLAYNTTYQWYVLLNDTSGCGDSTRYPSSGYFSFTTDTQIATLTKEWTVYSNNTIQMWINTTNVGEADLTNGYINETWNYDYLTLVGANMTADGTDPGRYNITWMNQTNSTWLTMFFSIKAPIPNGTVLSDTAKVIFNGTTINTFTPSTLPTMSFYAKKDGNISVIYWNTSDINFTINVYNTGDFYMNWTQINESYSPNLSYWESSITPNATNETFNITQIVPGATGTMWVKMNITGGDVVNGSTIYNNITVTCNQSSTEVAAQDSLPVGAVTTLLRITYISQLTEVTSIGNNVIAILGVLLVISAIMLIVYLMHRQGFIGGGG